MRFLNKLQIFVFLVTALVVAVPVLGNSLEGIRGTNEIDSKGELKVVVAEPLPEEMMAEATTALHNVAEPLGWESPETVVAAEPLPAEALDADVLKAVEGWAQAWSGKNLEPYLAYYAENFETPEGKSRRLWEKERQLRLQKPQFINVQVAFLGEPYAVGPNRMMVSFRQEYRSNLYSDVVMKTLELVKEDQQWKIHREFAQSWDEQRLAEPLRRASIAGVGQSSPARIQREGVETSSLR